MIAMTFSIFISEIVIYTTTLYYFKTENYELNNEGKRMEADIQKV